MSWYPLLKQIHMLTAFVTAILFTLRVGLDLGRVPWRHTPLQWVPHANDTVLLAAAIALVVLTGWMPFVHHWLTAKVLLLCGYIIAGKLTLDIKRPVKVRVMAGVAAFVQLGLIFWIALVRPF